jgi:hypothetical protein
VQDTALFPIGINPKPTRVELRDGIDGSATNPIVVNFSEKMDSLTDGAIYVRQWNPTNTSAVNLATTATLSGDGKSVSLVVDTPIPMGPVNFDVMIVQPTTDLAGNSLVLNGDVNAPQFLDAINPTNNSAIVLNACTFKDVTAGTPGTLAQTAGGEATEDQGNDFVGTINDHSQNLDASAVYTPADGPRQSQQRVNTAMDRLDELEDARDGTALNTHDSNTARLTYVAGDASSYAITVIRSAKDIVTFGAPAVAITVFDDLGIQQGNALNSGDRLPRMMAGGTYTINVSNAIPNDVVTVQPTDAFGYPIGAPATATLVDNTRPTTVLQHAYRDDNAGTSAPAVVATTGDGGELSWPGQAQQIGIPLLPITPHLLDMLDAGGNDISTAANRTADRSLAQELSARSLDSKTQMIANNAYDTTAFNNMVKAGLGRNIGVAFSEDVTITADPAQSTTAGFSGCVAQNNTLVRVNEALRGNANEDAAVGPNPTNEALDEADLVRCKTNDVLALANNDSGKTIDFNTVVADAPPAGNVTTADSRAQVVIQDDMPPFMTFAAFDGEVLDLKFNEAVKPISATYAPRLTFVNPNNPATSSSVVLNTGNTTVDATGMKLTVKPSAAESTALSATFVPVPSGTTVTPYVYVEDSTYYQAASYSKNRAPASATRLGHGFLNYNEIQDIRANRWADWVNADGSYAENPDRYSDPVDNTDINHRVGFASPRFAVVNALGRFESDIVVDGYQTSQNSTSTDQTVVISFSHPVAWGRADGLDEDKNEDVSLAELNKFYLIGDGQGDRQEFVAPVTGVLVTISADGRTLTLRFRTSLRVSNNNDATLSLKAGKYYTSSLLTTDKDGGTSAAAPGADGVYDPQTVYGAGTSISPKQ